MVTNGREREREWYAYGFRLENLPCSKPKMLEPKYPRHSHDEVDDEAECPFVNLANQDENFIHVMPQSSGNSTARPQAVLVQVPSQAHRYVEFPAQQSAPFINLQPKGWDQHLPQGRGAPTSPSYLAMKVQPPSPSRPSPCAATHCGCALASATPPQAALRLQDDTPRRPAPSAPRTSSCGSKPPPRCSPSN